MATSTLTTKWQLTVPKEVRETLGLKPGMMVDFRPLPDGSFVFTRQQRDVAEILGVVKYQGPPVTVEQMNQAIASGAAAE